MRQARTDAARAKAWPLAECLLALAGRGDPDDERTAMDAEVGAFVLAESLQLWRRSVTKR